MLTSHGRKPDDVTYFVVTRGLFLGARISGSEFGEVFHCLPVNSIRQNPVKDERPEAAAASGARLSSPIANRRTPKVKTQAFPWTLWRRGADLNRREPFFCACFHASIRFFILRRERPQTIFAHLKGLR